VLWKNASKNIMNILRLINVRISFLMYVRRNPLFKRIHQFDKLIYEDDRVSLTHFTLLNYIVIYKILRGLLLCIKKEENSSFYAVARSRIKNISPKID